MDDITQSLFLVLAHLVRYILFAGGFYLIFYTLKRTHFWHRKIKQLMPENRQIWFEIKNSVVSILIFGIVGYLTIKARQHGLTLMYDDFKEYSIGYFCISVVLLIVLHDTYFYWTHRLLHHPKLFKHVHSVHHQSHNPTPWAAFSFHPIEAIIEAGIFPLAVVVIPLHNYAVLIFMFYMILMNVMGHLGFELMSRRFSRHIGFIISNTSTHHYMHHRYGKSNYGLYFNLWDRFMQTNHPKYLQIFDEITTRKREKLAPIEHEKIEV